MEKFYIAWRDRFSRTHIIKRYSASTVMGGGLNLLDSEPRGLDQVNIKLAIEAAEKAAYAAGFRAAQNELRKALGL